MEIINYFGIVPVPAIVGLCYMAGEATKSTAINNKHIPTICCIVGVALGLIAWYCKFSILSAADPITASFIGGASGLAATGINQIVKAVTE